MIQLRGFVSLLMSMLNQDKILDELRETIKNKDIFAYTVKRTLFLLQKLFQQSKTKGSGITTTNNEIKDIRKVINSLENRRILSTATTKMITSHKGGLLGPLM